MLSFGTIDLNFIVYLINIGSSPFQHFKVGRDVLMINIDAVVNHMISKYKSGIAFEKDKYDPSPTSKSQTV